MTAVSPPPPPRPVPRVELAGWLTFTERRITGFTVKPPALAPGQLSCRVVLSVPKSVFAIPTFTARVNFEPAGNVANVHEVGVEFERLLRAADFRVEIAALPPPEGGK